MGSENIKYDVPVIRVFDGDSLLVYLDGRSVSVRLDSIDSPENDQPWGPEATRALIKLVAKKTIHLQIHDRPDKYDRMIATAFVMRRRRPVNVNLELVELGHAWVYRDFYDHLPLSRQLTLDQSVRWARDRESGLWSLSDPIPPWTWREIQRRLKSA